jgi:hypothetical protein
MFWRVINPSAHAVRRAVGLVRAALAPEHPLGRSYELAAPRAFHPHRRQLRARRARKRGGAVLARSQHCITPLARPQHCTIPPVRTALARCEPARRR